MTLQSGSRTLLTNESICAQYVPEPAETHTDDMEHCEPIDAKGSFTAGILFELTSLQCIALYYATKQEKG